MRLKGTCSEFLGLFGLLRHWVELEAPDAVELAACKASFFKICGILDLILAVKRQRMTPEEGAARLDTDSCEYMRLHIEAHGSTYVRPKHHWLLHVASQIRRDECVLDAFIIERQHLLVKSVADKVKNLTTFERSVMSGITNICMQRVAELCTTDNLLGKQAPLPGCPGVVVADRVRIGDQEITVGDVVWFRHEVGMVTAAFLEGDGTLGVLVELFAVTRRLSPHSLVAVSTGRVAAWAANEGMLAMSLAWKKLDAAGELLVVCG